MALVSMKTENDDDGSEEIRQNPYGYGLQLHLNDEQCKALGIDGAIPAGSQVMLNAMAIVSDSSQRIEGEADEPGISYSLCLQITDLELKSARDQGKALDALYPNHPGTGKA